jgi:predicted transcriptional regulator
MSQTTTMTVRLPVDLRDSLDRLADATERTRSWLAQDAIRKYVAREEWQIAEIEAAVREADAGDFATDEEVNAVRRKLTGEG